MRCHKNRAKHKTPQTGVKKVFMPTEFSTIKHDTSLRVSEIIQKMPYQAFDIHSHDLVTYKSNFISFADSSHLNKNILLQNGAIGWSAVCDCGIS